METVTDEGSKLHSHVSDNGIVTKQASCKEEGEILLEEKISECEKRYAQQ